MAIADVTRARLEVSTGAGAGDTFATLRQEKRAVTGALDQPAGAVEKLIGYPFQRNPAVRAAIEVDEGALALADHHQHFTSPVDAQAARVGKGVEAAQWRWQEIIIVDHQGIIPATMGQRQPHRWVTRFDSGGQLQ